MISFIQSAIEIGDYKPKHEKKWPDVTRNVIILQILPIEIIFKLFKTDIDLRGFDQILYNLEIDTSYGTTLHSNQKIHYKNSDLLPY